MVEYVAPPEDFSRLNPIQRYMQKGQLERQDYIWLILIVAAYFTARPYIQSFFKWWMGDDAMKEGEKAQEEYFKSKAKVGPNAIRGTETEDSTTIPEKSPGASGSSADKKGNVMNRKTNERTGEDQLLDWDDEPARKPAEGDKSDVVAWLDKWSNEQE
ncbi:hypothetical protein PV11_01537 [Exophiala sideris]|uniref:Uncharacterized protein n=1 Tax=Exophiala sideris TaxID=1016849 RepID=A0A0D1WAN1_9EURO|nr:hypothetical protein PV11_01537 [Exophiala sideris]